MKKLLVALTLLAAVTANAGNIKPSGKFVVPHEIAMFGYEDKAGCESDQGNWNADMQACFFETADSVVISRRSSKKFRVTVSTVVTNGNSCEFSSKNLKWVSGDTMEAVEKAENYDIVGADGQPAMVDCKVTLTFKDSNTVSVNSTFEECRAFCGHSADLTIEDAIRVPKK